MFLQLEVRAAAGFSQIFLLQINQIIEHQIDQIIDEVDRVLLFGLIRNSSEC